jgi:hypothetical protein
MGQFLPGGQSRQVGCRGFRASYAHAHVADPEAVPHAPGAHPMTRESRMSNIECRISCLDCGRSDDFASPPLRSFDVRHSTFDIPRVLNPAGAVFETGLFSEEN